MSEPEIDAQLSELNPKPQFISPMRLHQKVCFLIGVSYQAFGFWLEMGLGKTLLVLELARYLYHAGIIDRALVQCKTSQAMQGWEEEIRKWKIDVPFVLLDSGSSDRNWKILNELERGIVICTYPGLVAMVSDRLPSKKKKGKLKLTLSTDLIEQLGAIDLLALDESTAVGSHDTLAFKLNNRLRESAKFCYLLAGRPFGRDPTPLWSQCYLIDRGETLGSTLTIFREALFGKKKNYWSGFYEYIFRKQNEPILSRMLLHRTLAYTAEECGDLPELVATKKYVDLPDEAGDYFNSMVEQVIAAKGNYSLMQNMFTRMRQLSSGYIGFRDENEDKVEILFDENPKLDDLIELLREVPQDHKAIIFHEFIASGKMIADRMKQEKLSFGRLIAGMKDYRELKQSFDDPKGIQFLIVPVKLGSYSLNLQAANYEFVFESPVSPIDREQMERRTRRQGQTKTCFLYDLLVEGTMDERILDFHKEGNDLFAALVKNPAQILGKLARKNIRQAA